MSIRINGTPITSEVSFRKYFSLEDCISHKDIFIGEEIYHLFNSTYDKDLLRLLKESIRNSQGALLRTKQAGLYFVDGKQIIDLPYAQYNGNEDVICLSPERWQKVLLCHLGHMQVSVEANNETGKDGGRLKFALQNDEYRCISLFSKVDVLSHPIRTVEFSNFSLFPGNAHLCIQNEQGRVIDDVLIPNGVSLFGNCIGNSLIEILIPFSVSTDHCMYCGGNNGRNRSLCSKSVLEWDKGPFKYQEDIVNETTQFCADDEKGFLAISAGKLLPFSRTVNTIWGFKKYLERDDYVKVLIKGNSFILLTSQGNTVSNLDSMNLKNIVSIGIDGNYNVFAIDSNARLILDSNATYTGPTSNIYTVYSCDANSMSVKTRDGKTWLPTDDGVSITGKCLYADGHKYYLDTNSGEIKQENGTRLFPDKAISFWITPSCKRQDGYDMYLYDGATVLRKHLD